eukprot:CAMPEP_0117036876 /NCGR_PEP_ID=MMETSP0472-20121206/26083_1 /TAXON_ID=693140 ORGANISM="Tiarina fusus, Strain LIS" /NCGR_SAMPLE_ID=MMETSP0472 /ASSEMBLY_ACC=CAM_ASM_000603 /LENGTH=409 /DNA_ID=CAMNT_0004746737 /DNA_START=195 /DNA_END=1423 /DNA_ORIENTATION=-
MMRLSSPASLLAVAIAVVLSSTTNALLLLNPSSSSSSSSFQTSTALNQLGTGSSSGDWWNQDARVGYSAARRTTGTNSRTRSGYNNYGVEEVGPGNVGTSSMVRRSMTRGGRGDVGVREVGPNSIGVGAANGGGSGNIRPYQSGAIGRSSRTDRTRSRNGDTGSAGNGFFPRPGRYDSPVRDRSDRRGGGMRSNFGTIQGDGSRKTYSTYGNNDPMVVDLSSDSGRPIDTEVELWNGPDNTSHRMRFYSQNGSTRPFQAIVDTTNYGGSSSTMQVRNTGPMAFPMQGGVSLDDGYGYGSSSSLVAATAAAASYMRASDFIRVQGGSLRTMTVNGDVDRIRVDLETDGLPLMATIELWQGPGEAMQVAQIYNDCGRPFSTMVETPGGYGSTIAIRNEGPMEFPIQASIAY